MILHIRVIGDPFSQIWSHICFLIYYIDYAVWFYKMLKALGANIILK